MSNHGWVIPNPGGSVARCGGPGICSECSLEAAAKATKESCQHVVGEQPDPNRTPIIPEPDFTDIERRIFEIESRLAYGNRIRSALYRARIEVGHAMYAQREAIKQKENCGDHKAFMRCQDPGFY